VSTVKKEEWPMLQLSTLTARNFIGIANRCAGMAMMSEELIGRFGGYLCIADMDTGIPLLTVVIGNPTSEKGTKYKQLAEEKCARLAKHRGHVSSWQTRDVDSNQFGGAVRTSRRILGFSGFPEHWDEALCVAVAVEVGEMSDKLATEILWASQNDVRRVMKMRK